MPRWGLLLLNLGTPDSPSTGDVRRYLREFLSDPRVIDIHPIARKIIVEAFILPRRPKQSAAAYETVWTDRGSPLLFHGQDLARKVSERLGADIEVELGMRYGNPSIAAALVRLRERAVDRVVVLPLFPQYSSAAWGSAVEKALVEAGKLWNVPTIQVVPPFFDHPAYIESCVAVARAAIDAEPPDRILMSFHGLPERQIRKGDESTAAPHCLASADCCDRFVAANRMCYRAQCVATGRAIANGLGLADDAWEVTFQSRLGREPWVEPFTDVRVRELARDGVRNLSVLSPAFVADCLETLEELGMRAREDFRAHGGEELRLVPSLNAEDHWADGIVRILEDTTVIGTLRSGR